MARSKKKIQIIRTFPGTEEEKLCLDVFEKLKSSGILSIQDIGAGIEAPAEDISTRINSWIKKDLLMGPGHAGDSIIFNRNYKKILGIGFSQNRCIITLIDLTGNVLEKETLLVSPLSEMKGRNKELKEIVSAIGTSTNLKGRDICCCGIAVPEEVSMKNGRAAELLAEGISHAYNKDVFITSGTIAAGYGEKEEIGTATKEMLYIYSDIGNGVIIKGETIYEAENSRAGTDIMYLRPWPQFDIVNTAKKLVNKGVGTDIVNIVNGDVDSISLPVVLKASADGDELAEDLVKRAALALGVRVAYLVNMFGTDTVIFGGGIEKKEGSFIEFVEEGAQRFLLKERAQAMKIVPGKLGDEASSRGVASLCRREIFREV